MESPIRQEILAKAAPLVQNLFDFIIDEKELNALKAASAPLEEIDRALSELNKQESLEDGHQILHPEHLYMHVALNKPNIQGEMESLVAKMKQYGYPGADKLQIKAKVANLETNLKAGNPPADPNTDTQEAQQTKSWGTERPPEWKESNYKVPEAENYGKVVHVRSAGIAGYRIVTNRGTDEHRLFEYISGGCYPKTVIEELEKDPEIIDSKTPPAFSKGKKPNVIDYVELAYLNPTLDRRPLGLFVLMEKGVLRFERRDRMYKNCGRAWVEGIEKKIKADRIKRREYLNWHKARGLHPDTHNPLTDDEMDTFPWLVEGADPFIKIEDEEGEEIYYEEEEEEMKAEEPKGTKAGKRKGFFKR